MTRARTLIADPGGRFDLHEEGVVVQQGLEEIDWNGYDVLIDFERNEDVLLFGQEVQMSARYFFRPGEWEECPSLI